MYYNEKTPAIFAATYRTILSKDVHDYGNAKDVQSQRF